MGGSVITHMMKVLSVTHSAKLNLPVMHWAVYIYMLMQNCLHPLKMSKFHHIKTTIFSRFYRIFIKYVHFTLHIFVRQNKIIPVFVDLLQMSVYTLNIQVTVKVFTKKLRDN